jgi:hypothetical protein
MEDNVSQNYLTPLEEAQVNAYCLTSNHIFDFICTVWYFPMHNNAAMSSTMADIFLICFQYLLFLQ